MKTQELKILILEDVLSDVDLVKRTLNSSNTSFTSKVVHKKNDFINALAEFVPEVILSDHQLPGFDSHEAIKIVKEKNLNIPFILVTGTVSEEFAVLILKEGADDYILKNNLTRLPSAIKSAIEKRKAEAESINYQHQLENKINEINTFIYRISHDLKAPLASTFGLISHIRKNFKGQPVMEYIDMIEKSNIKMEKILLSFAEVVRFSQANKVEENINLKELLLEITEGLKNLSNAHGMQFIISADTDLTYYGNRAMMVSVFQNLLHNSVNYRKNISHSFVKVTIKELKNEINIEIEDNGIGIEREMQSKVFDMFYRATIASQGSGLGLYIVKNAVEKFGGSIRLKSNPGQGTSFFIQLPKKTS